jgi:hypothetical protein
MQSLLHRRLIYGTTAQRLFTVHSVPRPFAAGGLFAFYIEERKRGNGTSDFGAAAYYGGRSQWTIACTYESIS